VEDASPLWLVKKPASGKGGGGKANPPLTHTLTGRFCNNLRKDDSALISRFLHGWWFYGFKNIWRGGHWEKENRPITEYRILRTVLARTFRIRRFIEVKKIPKYRNKKLIKISKAKRTHTESTDITLLIFSRVAVLLNSQRISHCCGFLALCFRLRERPENSHAGRESKRYCCVHVWKNMEKVLLLYNRWPSPSFCQGCDPPARFSG